MRGYTDKIIKWWSKNAWCINVPSILDIYYRPNDALAPIRPLTTRPNIVWIPPLLGSIKINVDGSFSANFNQSCIWGIYRDHDGNVILHFSKEVQAESTI